MVVRGKEFDEIHDLVAIRVVVTAEKDCWAARTVHALWPPVRADSRIRQLAEFSLYQSLHTTVVGPRVKPLEIQIRTQEMHRRAEVRDRRSLGLQGVLRWQVRSRQQGFGPTRRALNRRDRLAANES